MRQRGRHGTQKVTFDYTAELSLGSHDSIVEAICRDTFTARTSPDAIGLHIADDHGEYHRPHFRQPDHVGPSRR
jgi:hypothetical protein